MCWTVTDGSAPHPADGRMTARGLGTVGTGFVRDKGRTDASRADASRADVSRTESRYFYRR